jgi:hypothetical protein
LMSDLTGGDNAKAKTGNTANSWDRISF